MPQNTVGKFHFLYVELLILIIVLIHCEIPFIRRKLIELFS